MSREDRKAAGARLLAKYAAEAAAPRQETTIHNRPPKFRRILARKLARRVRSLDRSLTLPEFKAAQLQIRSLRSRLNKVA